MSSRAANKGNNFERVIIDYLRAEFGAHITRPQAGAREDRGDFAGVQHWTLEAKAYSDLTRGVREGLTELAVEQANAGTAHGAVILKRHGKGKAEDQLFVCTLGAAVPLIRATSTGNAPHTATGVTRDYVELVDRHLDLRRHHIELRRAVRLAVEALGDTNAEVVAELTDALKEA